MVALQKVRGADLELDHGAQVGLFSVEEIAKRDYPLDFSALAKAHERDDDRVADLGEEAQPLILLILEFPERLVGHALDLRDEEVAVGEVDAADHFDAERLTPVLDLSDFDLVLVGVLAPHESEALETSATRIAHVVLLTFG